MYVFISNEKMVNEQAMAKLNEYQIKGVKEYGFTLDQVLTPYFDEDTLHGIDYLKMDNRAANNKEAFAMVEGLDCYQLKGFWKYRLTRDQVLTPNFGDHTLRALDTILHDNPSITYHEAFFKVMELDYDQCKGVLEYDLSREDVRTPNFDGDTLRTIDSLKEKDANLDNKTAFTKVEGLDKFQLIGVSQYGLEREQVLNPNYGAHTLRAIDYFKKHNPSADNDTAFRKIVGLDPPQISGVTEYEFTREQVLSPNFGGHTIDAINHLKEKYPDLTNEEAFSMVKWLNYDQCFWVLNYQLKKEQVLNPNFGAHTIAAIKYLKRNNPSLNNETAFSIVEDLGRSQVKWVYELTPDQLKQDPSTVKHTIDLLKIRNGVLDSHIASSQEELHTYREMGVSQYGLSWEQVLIPNFGPHTLLCIDDLKASNPDLNSQTAFAMIEGLDFYQCNGVLCYELTKEMVRLPYFGQYTLQDIDYFKAYNPSADNKTAFFTVEGLQKNQVKGVSEYELSREHVLYPNFGKHTLLAIDFLKKKNPNLNNNAAFNIVKGLDKAQTIGFLEYKLTRDEVLAPNFGEHTLHAIDDLMNKDSDLDFKSAFNKVRGLNLAQTKGVLEYGLDREQVKYPYFGYHTLIAIDNFKRNGVAANNEEAFSMVKGLDPNQSKGVAEYQLGYEQVQTLNFGEHILNYLDHCKAKRHISQDDHDYNYDQDDQDCYQEVFSVVEGLNRDQVRGIVVFGFTREQVENESYIKGVFKVTDLIQSAIPEMEESILYKTVRDFNPDEITYFLNTGLTEEDIRSTILGENTQEQNINSTGNTRSEEKHEIASGEKDLNNLAKTRSLKRSYTSSSGGGKSASSGSNKKRRGKRDKISLF